MDILLDTIQDTYIMLPVLFIMYLVLEYLEHHDSIHMIDKISHHGPFVGAILGMIPQCGFSVLASLLFLENKLTLGTLISVFIATSDEALPILMTDPKQYHSLIILMIAKVVIAIIVGYLVDMILKKDNFPSCHYEEVHDHQHFLTSVIIRTFKIYAFIFIFHFVLTWLVEMIGYDRLSIYLLNQSLWQPLVGALFGFIPHCASSVILTQLFTQGILSFYSLLAGLMTNAGLGLVVLIKNRIQSQLFIKICLILLLSALLICVPLQWFSL